MRSKTFGLLFGAAAIAAPAAAPAQQWRTIESARQLADSQLTSVSLRFAGGRFSLEPVSGNLAYQMSMRYDEQSSNAVHSYNAVAHRLTLGLEHAGVDWNTLREMKKHRSGSMSVSLNRALPMDLDVALGGAEGELELGGLRLRTLRIGSGLAATKIRFSAPNPMPMDRMEIDLGLGGVELSDLGNANAAKISISGGMSGVTLDFGRSLLRDTELDVNMALGPLKISVPENVGVTIRGEHKMGSFEPNGFTRVNGTWVTPNWDSATRRITIQANTTLGSVDVDRSAH